MRSFFFQESHPNSHECPKFPIQCTRKKGLQFKCCALFLWKKQGSLSGTSVWRPQSRYTVSRKECRIKFPQNQRCRAKIALHPRKSRCRTFLRTPLSHFPLIRSRQGVRRAGGGYRGTFGFQKRIALQGGIAATVTPVALLCATKKDQQKIRGKGQIRGWEFRGGSPHYARICPRPSKLLETKSSYRPKKKKSLI